MKKKKTFRPSGAGRKRKEKDIEQYAQDLYDEELMEQEDTDGAYPPEGYDAFEDDGYEGPYLEDTYHGEGPGHEDPAYGEFAQEDPGYDEDGAFDAQDAGYGAECGQGSGYGDEIYDTQRISLDGYGDEAYLTQEIDLEYEEDYGEEVYYTQGIDLDQGLMDHGLVDHGDGAFETQEIDLGRASADYGDGAYQTQKIDLDAGQDVYPEEVFDDMEEGPGYRTEAFYTEEFYLELRQAQESAQAEGACDPAAQDCEAYEEDLYEDGFYEEDPYEDERFYEQESFYEESPYEEGPYEEEHPFGDEDFYEEELYEEDSFDIAYGEHGSGRDGDLWEDDPYPEDQPEGFRERFRYWLAGLTAFDAIVASTGVVLLVAGTVILSMFLQTKRVDQQIQALAPMGNELTGIGVIGGDGLIAMADAAYAGGFLEDVSTEEGSSEIGVVDDGLSAKVNVSFASVQRDLKIRFTDAHSGELITGTVFEVTLTNAKGKTLVLTDDDMDGIINATNVNPGVFDAIVTSTDRYKFPSVPQQVTVKDKVEYIVINDIKDEVKKESQVNTAVEDTQKKDAQLEAEKIADTVEWVESSKTAIGGTEAYLLVDKNTIADPGKTALAGARMLFDAFTVTLDKGSLSLPVGGSAELKTSELPKAPDENTKYEYVAEWKSSDGSIATVSDGKVTAKAVGTATITCTVTRKTTTIKSVEGEDKTTTTTEEKTMTEEEYQRYKDEILARSNENIKYEVTEVREEATAEGTDVKQYRYTITIKMTEKGTGTTESSETIETSSASCQVTVSAAKITAASLELTKSADSCGVGGTIAVKPEKLVYTKEDGSTEQAATFPAITWSSSDKSIATVGTDGVVTGVKAGNVTITATITGIKGVGDKDIPVSASVSLTVSAVPVLSIALDRTKDVNLAVGGTTTLVATVSNHKGDAGVKWETSDQKVATVDAKGIVTGVAPGSVTITATTNEKGADGKPATAACTVTVNPNASSDTTTKLKDKNGNQIYIKDKDGNYKEAVYADYYTAAEFFIRTDGQFAYTGWQTIDGKTYYFDKNGKAVTGTQVIQGVTYNFGTDGAIATTVNGSTFGIDVSRHNGNIDWNAVKASGVDYVIIRCGYRGSATGVLVQDENFAKNIKGAKAAGLKVGVYVFSQAIDEVEAVKEASLAVQLVKGYDLTYPIFIDTESSGGRADKIDKATRTAVVNAFCQTVSAAGYKPGIYASKTWFEDRLNMGALGGYKIWLAQYSAAPSYKGRYDMWQYTSKGKISGIKGDVDLNYSYLGY